jgi:predicted PurR-regulated permease PerM
MAINGTLTALGLWLLGVPLALTLGLLAALLNFIPNIGPIIAGVPAVLLALMHSPMQALYVVGLYLVLQSVDGYLLTPLVDRCTVSVPPALTLAAQMLLGGLGLALASPLTAAAIVLVQKLYIEDTLGDRRELTGSSGKESLGRDVQAVED